MTRRLSVFTLFVNDQDSALRFYVDQLGFVVSEDKRLGDYRWLLVRAPHTPDVASAVRLSGASAAVSTTGSRQPRTDVLLAPGPRRGQHVETNPRRRGHEKRPRVRHVGRGRPYASASRSPVPRFGVSHRSEHAVGDAEQAPTVRLKRRGRIQLPFTELTPCALSSRDAAGAGQSQPADGQGNQPQHERRCPTDYSVAGAGTTVGDSQIQPAIDQRD
jgi:catechol 2,3-dioxygenase-like lactoylglutathione lyase family enzyme